MDLHIYRNSQDRWYDLKKSARERGAVLAVNAFTLDEFVQRLTPDVSPASTGQRLVLIERAVRALNGISPSPSGRGWREAPGEGAPFRATLVRYALDAIAELKGARVRSADLRAVDAPLLAAILDQYDDELRNNGLADPQDRQWLAGARVVEGAPWLRRFERVILHALYDLNDAEFSLLRSVIETLPDGGTVMLFNATANVKPTQFAEWTWQKFVMEESLADRAFPEFCRPSHPHRELLERLFVFEPRSNDALLDPEPWLRIIKTPGRYKEIEKIASDIADLISAGACANDVAVVVRQVESYGEMIEDVLSRYAIPYSFDTGVPLLRVPFIKYWLALLDLVTSERSRDALARVMGSAYYEPRLSPRFDVEQDLAASGYMDRHHMRASELAARKHLPLAPELERFERRLDTLEHSTNTVTGFLERFPAPPAPMDGLSAATDGEARCSGLPLLRDRGAWRVLVEELRAVDGIAGKVTFAEFRRIASDVASVRSVNRLTAGNTLPPGAPAVRIIHPHSLGYREYRWIFAPGLADGDFPSRAGANPLLSGEVIDLINRRIWPRRLMSPKDRNRREPLYLFMMMDSAIDRVTLTFPGNTLEGEAAYPSMYIGEIKRHYSTSPVEELERDRQPRETGEYLRKVADEWRRGRIEDARASVLLGEDIVRRVQWERLGIARGDIGQDVLPTDSVWSPTELDSLRACPFVFLARHRLKLRRRETPDFEVPSSEVGILAHEILREFHSEPIPCAANAGEKALQRMNEIINRRLAAVDVNGQGPYSVFDPGLWKIRRGQLVAALHEYADFAVKDSVAGFDTEIAYLDAPLPQAKLGETKLAGRPDHVAVHRTSGRIDAIRIDDFKYSAASSSNAKQLKESFQIPVYAYLAQRALAAEPGVPIAGRYLLLRSPASPAVSHAIDEILIDEVRIRIEQLIKKVSGGRLHPDPADQQDCTNCGYRRLCRYHGE
jgi:hypothetical protein